MRLSKPKLVLISIEEEFHKGFADRIDYGNFRIWDALFCEDAGKWTNTLKWKTKNQSLNDFFKIEFIILEILLYNNKLKWQP